MNFVGNDSSETLKLALLIFETSLAVPSTPHPPSTRGRHYDALRTKIDM